MRGSRKPSPADVDHGADHKREDTHHCQEVVEADVASRQRRNENGKRAALVDSNHLVGERLTFCEAIENLSNVNGRIDRLITDGHQDVALSKPRFRSRAIRIHPLGNDLGVLGLPENAVIQEVEASLERDVVEPQS